MYKRSVLVLYGAHLKAQTGSACSPDQSEQLNAVHLLAPWHNKLWSVLVCVVHFQNLASAQLCFKVEGKAKLFDGHKRTRTRTSLLSLSGWLRWLLKGHLSEIKGHLGEEKESKILRESSVCYFCSYIEIEIRNADSSRAQKQTSMLTIKLFFRIIVYHF